MRLARIGVFLAAATIAAAQVHLETGKSEQRRIEGHSTDSFTLDLKTGEYIEILTEQKTVDVVLRLISPDGKEIQETDFAGVGGTEHLFQVVDSDGSYRLEVRPLNDATAGEYVITLAARHPAGLRDREIAAADARFRELVQANSPDSAEALETLATEFEQLGVIVRRARAIRAAGALRARNENWDQAFKDYRQAADLYSEAKDRDGLRATRYLVGNAYNELDEYEKAAENFEEALSISRELNDRHVGAILTNIGKAYEGMSQYERAIGYWQQALESFREVGSRGVKRRQQAIWQSLFSI